MKLNWKTLFLLTTCCTLGLMTGVRAQITPDNSLGAENSNINPDSIQGISFDRIGGGATRGANLFHSFREFNVNNGQLVYFSNPAGIANILTRVTGVNRSNILGTLGVLGNANLFLINPNGIFFGPNASLDLGGGSFFGSSANSLLFDNGFEFSATNPQAPPLLTVNIPIGLRFRDNPGNITNRSVVQDITGSTVGLQVNPGNSLALVGGNVNLEQGGSLTAAGGRIELGGLAGAGTVGLQTTDNTFRLNFPANGLSNVSLADEAQATVRSNGGGDIAVNANIFTGRNGGQLVGGIEGIATRNGGDIIVNSNDISFDGVSSNRFTSGIFNNVQENGRGNAGGIDITTKNLSFTNGSEISAITFGNGNAGNVKIQASDISFDGVGRTGFSSGIFSTVQGNAVGNGNGIDITTGTLSLTNGAIINASTFATGDAGRIKIQASDTIFASGVGSNAVTSGIRSNVQENAMGNAGGIDISTKNLSFMNGAQIIADTLSNGNAGSVKIQANDISFDGVSSNGFTSGIFSTVQGNAEGNAGGIDITTGTLSLINGAVINASTYGNGSAGSVKIQASDISLNGVGRTGFSSGIFSAVTDNAIGNAGGIDITTKTLSLTNGGVLSASTSNGNAGNVTITASDRVTFAGLGSNGFGSGVYSLVESGANGNAGNIIINAASIFLDDRAVLRTTNANNGFAGDIALNARDQVSITNNSTISSDGNLGSIFIGSASNTTGAVVPNIINIDNSTLSTTNADPNGFAGNITLNARNQVSITNSSTVSSEGNLGSIFIGSLDTTNALSVLPSRINIDNSTLNTTNSNTDFAGDITLNARDEIFIKDSTISSNGNLGQIFIGDANSFLPALVRIEGANTRLSTANNTAPNQNAGSINIAAGRVVMNLGEISSNTFGSGRAGDISVQATGLVEFVDNALFSNVLSGAQNGQAGNITIKAGSVSLLNGAQLQSRVLGQGNGGNVTIDVPDGTVQIAGTNSQGNNSAILNDVGSGARGNAGNILINARNLSLTNGAQINSSTSGIGNAGNVTINASDRVSFAGFNNGFFSGVFSTVENGAVGKGGNINISARSLSLSDGALLTTGTLTQAGNTVRSDAGNIQVNVSDDVAFRSGGQLRSDTSGQGNAGNITIEGRNGTLPVVTLDGVGLINNVQRSSGIGSTVENNPQSGQIGNGKGGDITIRARSLSVTNGGVIDASTFAQGNAGNVTINASDRVSFAGFGSNAFSSGVYSLVASGAVGNGGNINISTGSLSLSDGAVVNALTSNSGDAGNITINANTFTANGGGQVLTTTFNSGSADQEISTSMCAIALRFLVAILTIINDLNKLHNLVHLLTLLTIREPQAVYLLTPLLALQVMEEISPFNKSRIGSQQLRSLMVVR